MFWIWRRDRVERLEQRELSLQAMERVRRQNSEAARFPGPGGEATRGPEKT